MSRPNIDRHVRRGHPVVFGLLIFFSIIEIAISAWLTTKFSSDHNEHSSSEVIRTHFILFASCWTFFLSIFYLTVYQLFASSHTILTTVGSHGVFFFLTWIFWVAGAAAVTEMIGGGLNCSTQDTFVYCNQLNAMMGFAWLEAILVTFATVIIIALGSASLSRLFSA